MGIRQAEQTKIAIGQRDQKVFPDAPDPPVRDPSRSSQYLSWVADFILCPAQSLYDLRSRSIEYPSEKNSKKWRLNKHHLEKKKQFSRELWRSHHAKGLKYH